MKKTPDRSGASEDVCRIGGFADLWRRAGIRSRKFCGGRHQFGNKGSIFSRYFRNLDFVGRDLIGWRFGCGLGWGVSGSFYCNVCLYWGFFRGGFFRL